MNALGMIETYGYLAAVEALDSALKSANVSLVDVILVKGGLVTVLIQGDVGAVKAAVDASTAAAQRVGQVVSVHVIPRPASDVYRMLTSQNRGTDPEAYQPADVETQESAPEQKLRQSGQNPEIPDRRKMKKMTVVQLRSLARKLKVTNMTPKEIRFAKKDRLIEAIIEFTGQKE